jgi:tight adherence protein C
MRSLPRQPSGISTTKLILAVLVPGGFGYYLPKYWVERRVQSRQAEIQNGFPDALDMLLVCVEAGQSLDQGIIRVSKELGAGYPALAEEFEIISQEVKAGKDKTAVLRAFGERAGVSDVSSFVTVMIQSQTFGTSIAEALRVYAAEMRDKRVMRAEEAANKLPTKMTLGTMMFTVPPLLIILVGPSVYDMLQTVRDIQRLNSCAKQSAALSPLWPFWPLVNRQAAFRRRKARPLRPAPSRARMAWTACLSGTA